MMTIIETLRRHSSVSDYKINVSKKESCELFFVKGRLETVRRTDTCDREVTVYVDHDGCKGDAQFFVYPSTTQEQLDKLVDEAAAKALLISNKSYELPGCETAEYEVESNFSQYDPLELAANIAEAVEKANCVENADLNAVEVFINKYTETVVNSRGLNKTQVRYGAMVEAIPTYNGEEQSVELYEQYNFGDFDAEKIAAEIAERMAEVKARYEAVKPEDKLEGSVVLGPIELASLFMRIAFNRNYSAVYSHSNLFKKGDRIQKQPEGDLINIAMAGEIKGCAGSTKFDSDGLSLGCVSLVKDGVVENYFGSNRFGQYLGETPTGDMRCMQVSSGSVKEVKGNYLEVLSMSGLQVDFFNDYIGGEVRLAYWHEDDKVTPVTGVAISGKLSEVLNHISLSEQTAVHNGYTGPAKAVLSHMAIF